MKISKSYAGSIVSNLGVNFHCPEDLHSHLFPSPPSPGLTLSACLCLCHPLCEAAAPFCGGRVLVVDGEPLSRLGPKF